MLFRLSNSNHYIKNTLLILAKVANHLASHIDQTRRKIINVNEKQMSF